MVKCPHCGALNDEDSRFCVQCGTRLPPPSLPSGPAPNTTTSATSGASDDPRSAAALPAPPPVEPARKPARKSLMQTLGLAPMPSPSPPAMLAREVSPPTPPPPKPPPGGLGPLPSSQVPPPARPAAPDILVGRGPSPNALADALTDAAARAAMQPPPEGSGLGNALAASAPRSKPAPTVVDAAPQPGTPKEKETVALAEPTPPTTGGSVAPASTIAALAAGLATPAAMNAPPKPIRSPTPPPATTGATPVALSASKTTSRGPAAPSGTGATSTEPKPSGSRPPPIATRTGSGGLVASPAPSSLLPRSGKGGRSATLPFGDLLDDIDTGFERIVQRPGTAAKDPTSEEYREVQALFTQIAATHMGPVRDFMIELKLGEPPREWLDLVLPAVRSLRGSATGMGVADLGTELDTFIAALEAASHLDDLYVGGETREQLLTAYKGLIGVMPTAFDLDEERDRREPIIVQSLLRQVPDVRKVALDKLYAAGLTSLAMYYVAKPFDIAEAAGLSREVSARIIERFVQHRCEIAELTPDATRTREHAKLDLLAAKLREQNTTFEVASRDRSKRVAEERRRLRAARNETVLQINVLLARLGEVALVNRLERLPFAAKVQALDEYLEEARHKNSPAPTSPGVHR
ncbi:MAG: zinc-ribbon domain-containing protein [Polyangiaceae bacterium]|nr:zinc-ribbon domain-containing protein [Polyangiaceae bacterium]